MTRSIVSAGVMLVLAWATVPLAAHHIWPVNNSRLVTLKGTVKDFRWQNPHPMISLEVKADDGQVEMWQVGGPAINRMEGNGWSRTTLKAGDVITGIGYQFTDGQKIVRLERIVLPDGKEMRVYARQ